MSDLLIRGMEMPTTCGKCKIKNAIECNRWKLVRSVVLDRHRDCPLIPVPPHGRLIDADALDADLERQDMHTGEWDAVGFSIEEIENAPTIIPAEEGE